jgi:2-iminobutanoate/2-iminopropanoate deaminase
VRIIETPKAPLPAGHYSQAVVANGLVFVAGVLPIVPFVPDMSGQERRMPEGLEAQARQVFDNLRHVLEAAGTGLDGLVNVQVFIPDVALWPSLDAVYREILGSHKPARTVVPCGPLHYGALIEVNAVAVAGQPAPQEPKQA